MFPTIFPIQKQPNTAWTRRQVRGYSGTLGDSFKSLIIFSFYLISTIKIRKNDKRCHVNIIIISLKTNENIQNKLELAPIEEKIRKNRLKMVWSYA